MFSKKKIIALTVSLLLVAIVISTISMSRQPVPAEILQVPDNRLQIPSASVTSFDAETEGIARQLKEVLKKVDHPLKVFGLGMAAPQIGYNNRIVALKRSFENYVVMVNPEVTEEKWHVFSPSACFSLKGIHFLKRPFWMKVTYQDLDGMSREAIFRGSKAATMKQEIDHLNGVLLTDY